MGKEKRKKREVFEVVVVNLLCCKHPFICESLFGRGDRVIVLYFGYGPYTSSVEVWFVVFGYGPYPSSVEVDCGCIASVALYG